MSDGGRTLDLTDTAGTAALAVRALLELTVLVVVGYWVFLLGSGPARYALAAGAVLALVLVWGALVAPKAPNRLPDPWRLGVEFVVFGLGAVAGLAVWGPIFAGTYVTVVIADQAVIATHGLR